MPWTIRSCLVNSRLGFEPPPGARTRSRPTPRDHRGPLTLKCRRTRPSRASAQLLWPFGDRTERGAYRSRCRLVTWPAHALWVEGSTRLLGEEPCRPHCTRPRLVRLRRVRPAAVPSPCSSPAPCSSPPSARAPPSPWAAGAPTEATSPPPRPPSPPPLS